MSHAGALLAELAAYGELTPDEKLFVGELASGAAPLPRQRQRLRIRGSLISKVLTLPTIPTLIAAKRVYICAVDIEGKIDISYHTLRFAAFIRDCRIPEGVELRGSSIRRLQFLKCELGRLDADRMHVSSDFDLDDTVVAGPVLLNSVCAGGGLSLHGSTIQGRNESVALGLQEVHVRQCLSIDKCVVSGSTRLIGARIDGNLQCCSSQLLSTMPETLVADGVRVGRNAFFRQTKSIGTIAIRGGRIDGNLEFDGAELAAPGHHALHADGLVCRGNVHLRSGFIAHGEVSLIGARITGTLDIVHATLDENTGFSLTVDGAIIKGAVFIAHSVFHGTISMITAFIGGQLAARSTKILTKTGGALLLSGAEIRSEVLLDGNAATVGTIQLSGARIGGNLVLEGDFRSGTDECWIDGAYARVKSVLVGPDSKVAGRASFPFLHVRNVLRWSPQLAPAAALDLTCAYARKLIDREDSWPGHLCLNLDGFSFEDIDESSPRAPQLRLAWIQRQGKHVGLSAYEQLARFYDRIGNCSAASRLRIQHEKHRRSSPSATWLSRVWSRTYGATVGYGYEPSRATYTALVLCVFGSGVFWMANHAGIMHLVEAAAISDAGRPANPWGSGLSAIAFSLDSLLPIVDLGHEKRWMFSHQVSCPLLSLLVEVYYFCHVLAGWFLGALLAIAVGRVVKQRG